MTTRETFQIGSYSVAGDLHYDRETHLWVLPDGDGVARCGFDPLGAETSGDIVAVEFDPIGRVMARGDAFGSIEAAKFVGPLVAPLSGTIRAHNMAVLGNPALLNEGPLDHWMIEIEPSDLDSELGGMVTGEAAVRSWFEAEVARFRSRGMLAE